MARDLHLKDPVAPSPDGAPRAGREVRAHRGQGAPGVSPADAAHAERDPMRARVVALGIGLVAVLVVALVVPPGWFSVNMRGVTTAQWLLELRHRVGGLVSMLTFQGAQYSMDFVTCKYLVVAIAGGALAVSGAVFQGSLKNALASPSTLGVMTGCNLGRILYVMLFLSSGLGFGGLTMQQVNNVLAAQGPLFYTSRVYGMALMSLACGLVVVALVIGVSTAAGHGRVSSVVMIIAGQVVSAAIGAGVGLVQYYLTETGDARAEILRNLQVESFTNTFRPIDLVLVGVPVAICLAVVLVQRRRLDLLAFKEEEARSMGLETRRSRWVTVLACTALTGVIVAFCGQVGMVGFMIPHFARRVVGPHARHLIPASGFMGAGFLVLVYFVASLFETGTLTTVGVYTSILGGLVFLAVAIAQRGRTRGDWM